LCCDVGLVSELRLTAGCVLMDLANPAVLGTSVYASGLRNALPKLSLAFFHSSLALQLSFLNIPVFGHEKMWILILLFS